MSVDTLSRRELNRATLERQLLLRRQPMPLLEAVAHLVGLQAQVPLDPYTALWSRLEGFDAEELGRLLLDRRVVRLVAMRGTIHLLTADDALELRPLFQPVLDKELQRHRDHGPPLDGVDLAPVLDHARRLMADRPRTQAELRQAFTERFPDHDAGALAYACRNHLALVQVPPRGVWGQAGQVRSTTVDAWLGRPVADDPSLDDLVLRYLTAFGPATNADLATWSRLTGLGEVVDRLSPSLRPFRDEAGRSLVDLPDAPRPGPDVPAPVRFLPEYDNVLLSHADRSRFLHDDLSQLRPTYRIGTGSVLWDGEIRATWRLDRAKGSGSATLTVSHTTSLGRPAREEIEGEAHRLVELVAADAGSREVRLQEVG